MLGYFKNLLSYFLKLESKIAFYPTIFSLLGFFFAFFMYYAESLGVSKYLVEHVPLLVINNVDTARVILTTFIAGLISIMVFSFSMVMILLNQASSNFSPRVLPGLISNRRHQFILGIYNACLLYCIFTLISIEPTGDKYQLPGFSVLLSILFMTICLAAFIYFIHSISQEIQVNTILSKIFKQAESRLTHLINNESKDFKNPTTDDWHTIESDKTGYYRDCNLHYLSDFCNEHSLKITLDVIKGGFVLKGTPLLKISNEINESQKENLLRAIQFSNTELISDNYVLAFKQITEIAVKAMSPGINDPGTAINAIDYLTELFLLRLQKRDASAYYNSKREAVVFIKTLNFKTLLYSVMASLRTYCKHDVLLVKRLLKMLVDLKRNVVHAEDYYQTILVHEMKNLLEDAEAHITNTSDWESVEDMYKKYI